MRRSSDGVVAAVCRPYSSMGTKVARNTLILHAAGAVVVRQNWCIFVKVTLALEILALMSSVVDALCVSLAPRYLMFVAFFIWALLSK